MKFRVLCAACALFVLPISGCAAINEAASVVSGQEVVSPDLSVFSGADVDVLAFASVGMWRVLQAEAASVVVDADTSDEVREGIRRADAFGSGLMLELSQLAELYGVLKFSGRDPGEPEFREVRASIEMLLPIADSSLNLLGASVAAGRQSVQEVGR